MILHNLVKKMSSRKSLLYIGASKIMLYYKVNKKNAISSDKTIVKHVEQISVERPAYGTCRLTAVISKKLKSQ